MLWGGKGVPESSGQREGGRAHLLSREDGEPASTRLPCALVLGPVRSACVSCIRPTQAESLTRLPRWRGEDAGGAGCTWCPRSPYMSSGAGVQTQAPFASEHGASSSCHGDGQADPAAEALRDVHLCGRLVHCCPGHFSGLCKTPIKTTTRVEVHGQ